MKKVFTTREVADLCGVHPRTVSKWFDSGRLVGYRIPGSQDRRIPREHLDRFCKEHEIKMDDRRLAKLDRESKRMTFSEPHLPMPPADQYAEACIQEVRSLGYEIVTKDELAEWHRKAALWDQVVGHWEDVYAVKSGEPDTFANLVDELMDHPWHKESHGEG